MNNDYPFTKEEFDTIYHKVPRLTVEIIVQNKEGAIYMTKRAIEPCSGQWHLPGGTVYFGEALLDEVKRIALKELSITVQDAKDNGYIEYPSHYKKGLDSPIGIVFEVTKYEGHLKIDNEASDSGWFTKLPKNTHADQDNYLLSNGYLLS
jgi:ADP-ribose pyrophosphatase YjhB (NUDIX family)